MAGTMKKYTLDEIKDRFIVKPGSAKIAQYEMELKLELIGALIKKIRKESN